MPIKEETTKELGKLFNELVDEHLNEIDAVFVQEIKTGFIHYSSTTTAGNNPELVEATKAGGTGIASAAFTNFGDVSEIINRFGREANRGQMNYTVFQLTKGILLMYLMKIRENTFGVFFVSESPGGVQSLMLYSGQHIDEIKEKLEALL
jgi:hypothetical protein